MLIDPKHSTAFSELPSNLQDLCFGNLLRINNTLEETRIFFKHNHIPNWHRVGSLFDISYAAAGDNSSDPWSILVSVPRASFDHCEGTVATVHLHFPDTAVPMWIIDAHIDSLDTNKNNYIYVAALSFSHTDLALFNQEKQDADKRAEALKQPMHTRKFTDLFSLE